MENKETFAESYYIVQTGRSGLIMLVVIEYQMGNVGSIMNMLKKVGDETCILSNNYADIEKADRLILPGVGSFDNGIKNLYDLKLITILNRKVIEEKTPILGICLGMQLFANSSEEGSIPGLGWIDAEVIKFNFSDIQKERNKIPHIGWNNIRIIKGSPLFDDMYPEPRFYFLHSYHISCKNESDILTKTFYGYDFVSSISRANIIGVQFHPEKSHKFGMKLLKNFLRFRTSC